MGVLKMIGKIILGIIRVPFTVWYLISGLMIKVALTFTKIMHAIAKFAHSSQTEKDSEEILKMNDNLLNGIITFEWASLVKIYHFKW